MAPIALVVVLGITAALYWFGVDMLRSGRPATRVTQHIGQGMTYASMKDYDNAIREFSLAIELAPNHAVPYANRAVAYMQQRKFNKALDDLQKAAALDPRDKMVHYNLAALYAVQGQKDRALDSLDRALRLGFDQYDALRNDPDLDILRGDPEFRRVLERNKVFAK